jgi:hypothetical protein
MNGLKVGPLSENILYRRPLQGIKHSRDVIVDFDVKSLLILRCITRDDWQTITRT